MKNYLCTIIEMYDGREFVYDELLISTDQNINKVLMTHIENITDEEDDDWSWQGKWWSNDGESAYTIGSIRDVPDADKQVLQKYMNPFEV